MRYFGTDGIRGKAEEIINSGIAEKLGLALAGCGEKILIGRDVREHSPLIEKQLVRGLLDGGAKVLLAGEVPTPVLSFTAARENADFAVMITASHNPPEYNGLKVFGECGKKLSPEDEKLIDNALSRLVHGAELACDWAEDLKKSVAPYHKDSFSAVKCGEVQPLFGVEREYKRYVMSLFPSMTGFKVKLDCANGCYSGLAAEIMSELGAQVSAVNDARDGKHVNENCGSVNIKNFITQVERDEMGFAFDGDGDRVLAVVDGKIYDGDAILLSVSMLYKLRGKLKNRFIVGTVLTNSRLQRELAWQGAALLRTGVGDKYVLDALIEQNCVLGGEKSGHIIMLDKSATGDGLLTALTLMEAKKTMGSLPKFSPYPMREFNFPSQNPKAEAASALFQAKVKEAEMLVGGRGRIIARPSGTEPVIRVAAEYFSKNHGEIFEKIYNIFAPRE